MILKILNFLVFAYSIYRSEKVNYTADILIIIIINGNPHINLWCLKTTHRLVNVLGEESAPGSIKFSGCLRKAREE